MYTEIYQNQCSADVGIKNWETSCFAVNNEATEPRVEVITSTALRLSHWLGLPIWNICVANDHGYVQPVENTFRFFRHSWFVTGFVTRLTWRVPLVYLDRQFYKCCFVDSCLSFFSCPLCTLSFDLRILITFWYLKTLLMSVRPHNRWWQHEGNHIVVDSHYYNTTYNTTYSVVSCGRLSSAFSLTSDIVLLFMVLKYIASHYIAVL